MKFPCTLKNALLIIRDHFGLTFASRGLGYLAAYLLLLSLPARYKLSCYQTTPLLTISAVAEITLPKTICHFLLLLVGFDTLTYRKELQLIPYTCGSSVGWLTRHHAMENCGGQLEVLDRQIRPTKSIIVQDVDAATTVHKYLSEFIATYPRGYH